MKKFTFRSGLAFTRDGQPFTILRTTDENRLVLERPDGSAIVEDRDVLLAMYAQGRLTIVNEDLGDEGKTSILRRPLCTFPDDVQADAVRRKKYLDYLRQYGPILSTPTQLAPLIEHCANSINDPNPPSPITIYRWNRALVSAQYDSRSLISKTHLKGKAGSRLHPDLQALVQEAIEQVYLSPQRATIEDTYSHLEFLVANANKFRDAASKLIAPSKSTVTRAVRSLDKYEAAVARNGPVIANKQFRVSGRGPQASRILERVEIDHTPLDLFVICSRTHLPMGRPTLTVAIDKYSRMVLGVHIGFDGPSIEAVFACLRHAILPKSELKTEYPDIENPWPCYGTITELVCDNGLEFHALELERVAFETGMTLTFCPKRAPYYKGAVERVLKTINYKLAHGIPGTSFARWFHREDYDSQAQAVIPFDVLRSILFRWLVDIYAQSIHRGIGTTPYAKWIEGTQSFTPTLPVSPERLDIALGRTVERSLNHAGIELHNLRYNGAELLKIRRQLGSTTRVEVRYYIGDLSYIHVIDPVTKEAIPVPALDLEYATNLSLPQHQMICKHVRSVANETVNSPALIRAKAAIRQVIFDMQASKKQRERQRGHRIGTVEIPDTKATTATSVEIQAPPYSSVSVTSLPRLKTSSVTRTQASEGAGK
jgi:putative transposase